MPHALRLARPALRVALLLLLLTAFTAPARGLPLIGPAPSAPTTGNSPKAPPLGGEVHEGESLGQGSLPDTTANGGAYARTTSASVASGVPAGFYRFSARVRALQSTRLDLLADGEIVGNYWVSGTWRTVVAVVRIGGSSEPIGIRSSPAGSTRALDVDWMHLGSTAPNFTVRGNRAYDPSGAVARFRGVKRAAYKSPAHTGDDALFMPRSDGQQAWIWGASVVRLSLNQEHWLADCPAYSEDGPTTYRRMIARNVEDHTSRGVMLLLDLTITERGEATGCAKPEKPYLKEMADERSVTFWQSVAGRFKGEPLVAFDLFNEPHDISPDVWRNGGEVEYKDPSLPVLRPTATYRAVGMQRLYNAVRSSGAENLVFVSGHQWATDPRVLLERPIDGYGIVAAAHSFCEPDWGTACTMDEPRRNPLLDTLVSPAVLARHPVVITETGWGNPDDGRFNRLMIDWAEAKQAGWVVYAWTHPGDDPAEDRFTLLTQWDPSQPAGGGYVARPPSAGGVPVWNSLAANRTARGLAANLLPE